MLATTLRRDLLRAVIAQCPPEQQAGFPTHQSKLSNDIHAIETVKFVASLPRSKKVKPASQRTNQVLVHRSLDE